MGRLLPTGEGGLFKYINEGPHPDDMEYTEPTLEDQMIYEAEQKQTDEWRRAGLCQGCGKEPATPTGYCEPCMDEFYADDEINDYYDRLFAEAGYLQEMECDGI